MAALSTSLIQAERDGLALLGLLANCYARFDVPVAYPNEAAPSHVLGLNIHAAIIDNSDGELMALERNTIHSDGSPLQHGEQRALRTAITRVASKRPRTATQSIEDYYRSSMFMAKGTTPEDFLNLGSTLYTTLEPCPMCASSLHVTRMKRIVFLIPDAVYGRAWQMLNKDYYKTDQSQYQQFTVPNGESHFADKVFELYTRVMSKVDQLGTQEIRATHFLDFCRDDLSEAFTMLLNTKSTDLESVNGGDSRNSLTLANLRRSLNMPFYQ